jgi:hypothetical protein
MTQKMPAATTDADTTGNANEDAETRYFLDLNLATQNIIRLASAQRQGLDQVLPDPTHHRLFLTKGQHHKLEQHLAAVKPGGAS